MKNLVLIVAVMLLNVAAFANETNPAKDKSKVVVKSSETTSVTLRMFNLENKVAKIALTSSEGNVVFSKKVKNSDGFAMKFDFSRLLSGDYTLTVDRDEKIFTQSLSVNGLGTVIVGEMVEYEKPTLTQTKSNFTVANPSNDITSVSVVDEKGSVLYKKKYSEKEQAAKSVKYDLGQVKRGNYQVIVATTGSAFYFDIKK